MSIQSIFNKATIRLGQIFFPISIIICVIGILVLQMELSAVYSIYGLYPILGLSLGAVVYYFIDGDTENVRLVIDERLYKVGVYVTIALTVAVVAITDTGIAVLVGLGVGYILVILQVFTDSDPLRLIPQITGLFLLSPVTKYLTAGFYYGHGDILTHVRLIEDVMIGGSLGAISPSIYKEFPGFHLITATVGSISGLTAYDGIMLTGIVAYAIVIPGIYLITLHFTKKSMLAFYTAFAVVILDDVSFFTSYFFPQSLATVLIILLVLLACMVSRDKIKWVVISVFAIIAITLSFTHHLTQVLFVPVFVLPATIYVFQGRKFANRLLLSRELALFVFLAVLTGYRLYTTGFIWRIHEQAMLLIRGGILGGYTQTIAFSFGTVPRSTTVVSALEWLMSPYGIYQILLVLIFSLGVVTFLRTPWPSASTVALSWTGIIAAILVFETPLSIKSLSRISYPWLFVFAFVVGLGLFQIRRRVRRNVVGPALILILVLAATMAPVVTADNYYGLDPRPTSQSAFSDQEYKELHATSGFIKGREESTTVFSRTRVTMARFRVSELQYPRLQDGRLILSPGYLVYRTAWSNYRVSLTTTEGETLYSHSLYVSDSWLQQRVMAGNKVYTAGGTGVMWKESERPFENL